MLGMAADFCSMPDAEELLDVSLFSLSLSLSVVSLGCVVCPGIFRKQNYNQGKLGAGQFQDKPLIKRECHVTLLVVLWAVCLSCWPAQELPDKPLTRSRFQRERWIKARNATKAGIWEGRASLCWPKKSRFGEVIARKCPRTTLEKTSGDCSVSDLS